MTCILTFMVVKVEQRQKRRARITTWTGLESSSLPWHGWEMLSVYYFIHSDSLYTEVIWLTGSLLRGQGFDFGGGCDTNPEGATQIQSYTWFCFPRLRNSICVFLSVVPWVLGNTSCAQLGLCATFQAQYWIFPQKTEFDVFPLNMHNVNAPLSKLSLFRSEQSSHSGESLAPGCYHVKEYSSICACDSTGNLHTAENYFEVAVAVKLGCHRSIPAQEIWIMGLKKENTFMGKCA